MIERNMPMALRYLIPAGEQPDDAMLIFISNKKMVTFLHVTGCHMIASR